MTIRCAFAAALIALGLGSPAFAADAVGCKDLSGLKRFEGSTIALCEKKTFAEYTLATGPVKSFDFGKKVGVYDQKLDLEGRLVQNVYAVPKGPSSAEVFRNYKQELEAKGFKILFEAKKSEIGDGLQRVMEQGAGGQTFGYSQEEARFVSAEKEADGVKTHLGIYVVEYADGYNPVVNPVKGQVYVRVDEIQSGELKNQMVLVSAEEIAKGLDSSGRVALYGLLFDFNKATLQPESKPTLDEIAKFLKANPGQKVHVVGHTDNVGGVEFNQKLSQARANAVVAELSKGYGVQAARMRPVGVGLLSPVASNAEEDGRAKNRRVELLPQ
ncbi:OmpA family protein [Methylopila sp. M107]|uniref:OmpA family protein n=1 Tax=Methylopila sp. M107 TaxID=1101190 RepID=UPI00035D8D9C|nr:OmpA family protein [Methylopila sp. M107]